MSDMTPPPPGDEQFPSVDPGCIPRDEAPALAAEEEVVLAQVVEDPPRLWPTFVVTIGAIGVALVVSGVVMVAAALSTAGTEVLQNPHALGDWLAGFVGTRMGLAVLVLPGQLSFCAVTLIAALLSPQGIVHRLGFGRSRMPAWTWLFFLMGTPLIGVVMAQLMSVFAGEPSEQLKMIERLFEQHAAGSLVMLLVLIAIVPGVVEEMLFRGYMQRRLLTRLPAGVAIAISTVFFAAAHMDPMHAIGVAPLGIWLGVVAWRADSIWPAIFGHVGNNAYAVVMSALSGSTANPESTGSVLLAILGATLLAFFACLAILIGSHSGSAAPVVEVAESGPRPGGPTSGGSTAGPTESDG